MPLWALPRGGCTTSYHLFVPSCKVGRVEVLVQPSLHSRLMYLWTGPVTAVALMTSDWLDS